MRTAILVLAFGSMAPNAISNVAAQVPARATSESPVAFEVASVKRNYMPEMMQRARLLWAPGRFTATNATLKAILSTAFDLSMDTQLIGGPDWMNTARFDVEAVSPGSTREEMRPMLQRLLSERFRLVSKSENRVLPVYKLTRVHVDRDLPQALKAEACGASPEVREACGKVFTGASSLRAVSVSMSRLAKLLVQLSPFTDVDRIVLDDTGLKGEYSFEVRFSPSGQLPGLRSSPNPDLPSFVTALREQLGLKLQPANEPVAVVIIQSAALPSGN